MFAVPRRHGFTLRDLFMAILLISIALTLLMAVLPRMRSRGPSMRNACINNIKQVGLALHNYHDVYRKFPVIAGRCENLFEQRIGYGSGPDPNCTMAQYSWIVRILPFIEEGSLYNELAADSDKFRVAAFDRSLRVGTNNDSSGRHFSQYEIPALLCPTFNGEAYSDELLPAGGYKRVLPKIDRVTGRAVGVALTNYVAIPATHKERLTADGDSPPHPNGVLVSGKANTLEDIHDGTGHTIVVAETKETSSSSWYDSSGTWVVVLLPRQDLPPDLNPVDFPATERNRLRTALNVGPTDREPAGYGMGLPDNVMRRWGPSSNHDGDIVNHCFADASVRTIKADIDPLVYAALVTRNGGENVNTDALSR